MVPIEEAIDLIKSEDTVFLKSGLRTLVYTEVPVQNAIDRIKYSDFGALMYRSPENNKYYVEVPSFMDMM